MQKVNFSWELIIADDFSTDGTREILLEYKDKNPDFIKLILQKENVGPAKNWLDLLCYPKSKYIAYIEGDDYWINPLKLQRQVNVLEQNTNYSLCFHNALLKSELNPNIEPLFNLYNQKLDLNIDDVIIKWQVSSASIVYRRAFLVIPEWLAHIYNGDYALQLLLVSKGPFKYIDEVMSVYRQTLSGLSSKYNLKKNRKSLIELFSFFDEHTERKHSKLIEIKKQNFKREIKYLEILDNYALVSNYLSPLFKYFRIFIEKITLYLYIRRSQNYKK